MRVVQVIPAIATRFGGPSIGAIALHDAFLAAGHDAILIAGAYAEHDGTPLTPEVIRRVSYGRNLILLPPRRPYSLKYADGLMKSLWRTIRHADLVHVHGQYLAANAWAPTVALLSGVPYGVQPHGTLESYQYSKGSRVKSYYHGLVGSRILDGARYVLVASAAEVENSYHPIADRALVTPLGATLSKGAAPKSWPPEVTATRDRSKRFLFLGRLANKKRPDLAVQAWAASRASRDSLLIVAGPDDDISRSDLLRLASRLGVADSVFLPGEVDLDAKSWLYRNSGTFILPSENENFAVSVAEAMLAGCAVITTSQVAAAEHVRAADVGLVLNDPDEQQLARGLDQVHGYSEAELATLRLRSMTYAEKHLSWDRVVRLILGRALAPHAP